MAKQQASFLDIIGISSELAQERYNIQPISSFIDSTCVNILKRIVANPEHPITVQIRRPASELKVADAFPYRIPGKVSKSAAYHNSFLPRTINLMRDSEAKSHAVLRRHRPPII